MSREVPPRAARARRPRPRRGRDDETGVKRTFRRLLVGGLGLMALTSACTDNGTGPDEHLVVVSPSRVTVEAGDTVRLTATLQENGRPVETPHVDIQ